MPTQSMKISLRMIFSWLPYRKKKIFFLSFTLTVTNLKQQLELDMEQQTGSK